MTDERTPRQIEALQGVSTKDRQRIVNHIADTVRTENQILDLMGANPDAPDHALDARHSDNAQAVSAVSRDLHGLTRPSGSEPGYPAGTFDFK